MFHNPLDYFLSVRLKIFIFQILQLGRTPNEFRHKPIPSPKEFWMILLHWILSDGEKRHKKTCIANSQYLKRTQKHIIYSISIIFSSGLWGFEGFFFIPHFSLCSCHELYILHFLFTLVLIFSLQQKNYDSNDDYEDDHRNAESDNHDQSVVVGWGICRWKIKQLIITFHQKISYFIYLYLIICYHNYIKLWTIQNSLTILTEFSIR